MKQSPLTRNSIEPSWAILALAVLPPLLLHTLARYFEAAHDPREPPLVRSKLPLVGHVIGMLRRGPKYFQQTSARTTSPIYTLNFLTGKIYVVTSPDLIAYVSRNSRSISFNPFIAELGIRMTRASDAARRIIERNIDGSQGRDSYVVEIHDRTVAALTPGPEMNAIGSMTLEQAWGMFLEPIARSGSGAVLDLYGFLRHMVTVTSTNAIYGPTNPLGLDPAVEQAFWDFDRDLNMLLLDIHPEITAWRGHRGRERIAHAFKAYFDADPRDNSSALAKARCSIGFKHGMSTLDMGRLEVGTLIGVLVNTVPTVFYLILHIFQSDSLVEALRAELQANALSAYGDAEVLDVTSVRERCPLLKSTYQETLRTYSEMASARLVVEDTLLDGRWLLKRGGILQMPNSVLHRDQSVWGDASFNPHRFLSLKKGPQNGFESSLDSYNASKRPATSASHYRPFGGGSTLCPGRHFASAEILGLVALLLWRFQILPMEAEWAMPQPKQDSVVEGVFPPQTDVRVRVEGRPGLKNKWRFAFT